MRSDLRLSFSQALSVFSVVHGTLADLRCVVNPSLRVLDVLADVHDTAEEDHVGLDCDWIPLETMVSSIKRVLRLTWKRSLVHFRPRESDKMNG